MNKIYAVVLTQESHPGIKKDPADPDKLISYEIVSRVNTQRPYNIIDNDENLTRAMLQTEFPDGWVVIGPEEFLANGHFDLCEEDFGNPQDPTGIAPSILKYEQAIEDDVMMQVFDSEHYLRHLEQFLIETYPESEVAKFIQQTYKEIKEDGLRGISGANFERGDVPFTFLHQRKNSTNTYEGLAHSVNHMRQAVLDGRCKDITFGDSNRF